MRDFFPAPILFLTEIKTDISLDTIFGGVIDVIIKLALYVGILMAAGGIFSLVLAYKDENAEAQTRSARYIVVGVFLIGLRLLLQTVGLIG